MWDRPRSSKLTTLLIICLICFNQGCKWSAHGLQMWKLLCNYSGSEQRTNSSHPPAYVSRQWNGKFFIDMLIICKWQMFWNLNFLIPFPPKPGFFFIIIPPPSFQAFAHDWMWLLHPRDQRPQMMKLDYSCFPLINTSRCQRLFDWHNLLLILLPKLIDAAMLDKYKTNMCLHVRTSSAIKLSSLDVDPCSDPAMQTFSFFFFFFSRNFSLSFTFISFWYVQISVTPWQPLKRIVPKAVLTIWTILPLSGGRWFEIGSL